MEPIQHILDSPYPKNFSGANLRSANLRSAYLTGAYLTGADLRSANLTGANLTGANLTGANLTGANLRSADLRSADLTGAKGIPLLIEKQLSIVTPDTKIVYKKCREGVVVLELPANAARSNATGRKCRAAFAIVLSLPTVDGKEIKEARSLYNIDFVYRKGETVRPLASWCEDRWQECASGIHFFLTREEAEAFEF